MNSSEKTCISISLCAGTPNCLGLQETCSTFCRIQQGPSEQNGGSGLFKDFAVSLWLTHYLVSFIHYDIDALLLNKAQSYLTLYKDHNNNGIQ